MLEIITSFFSWFYEVVPPYGAVYFAIAYILFLKWVIEVWDEPFLLFFGTIFIFGAWRIIVELVIWFSPLWIPILIIRYLNLNKEK